MRFSIALTLFATLTLASAGGAQPPLLTGTTWTLTQIQESGQTILPNSESRLTLKLDKGSASGFSGCNTYKGSYSGGASSLNFGPLASTRMACPEAPLRLETHYLNVLKKTSGFHLSGQTLTLFTPSGNRLVFQAAQMGQPMMPARPQSPLPITLDGTWTLMGGTALGVKANSVPTLTIAGTQVSGFTGCNRLFGKIKVTDGRASFESLGTTRMACTPELNAQEAAFLRFLAEPSLRLRQQGQVLTLTAADNRTMIFKR